MSIVALQKRARRLGEIRLGDTVTKGGKTFPVSLDTFRLTSAAKGLLDQAAGLWGGEVVPWAASENAVPKWQLVTDVSELPVVIPPQDPDGVTWYESWTAGGLQRRCDGDQIVSRGEPLPCVCDPDSRECRMVTRLQVMMPQLPDVGVWVLSSTGFYAASEMAMSIQIVMQAAQSTGLLPEAVLAIEHREVKRPGEQLKKFVVPVLRFRDPLSTFLDNAPNLSESATPSLPGGIDGGGGGTGDTVQHVPAPLPAEPVAVGEVVAEIVEDTVEYAADEEPFVSPTPADESDPWPELLNVLNETPDQGTMAQVEDRIRRLFRFMHAAGLWPESESALRAALIQHYQTEHLTDLRKAELNAFATMSWEAATQKVAEAE